MDGHFAWMLPVILGSFGALFLAVRRAGAGAEAKPWGFAFLVNAAGFAAPLLAPLLSDAGATVLSDVLFAVAFFFYADALLVRFRRPRMLALRSALLAMSIAAALWAVYGAASLTTELLSSDLSCAAATLVALAAIPRWPRRGIDRAVVALSWLSVIETLARAAALDHVIGAGDDFRTYLASDYALLLQTTATLIGFAFALAAFGAVMLDILAAYRREARLDPLTGLLNRRGFLEEVQPCVICGSGSVVLCDLDRFKLVNDTWGHDTGDRVLAGFADLLARALPADGVAARLGGEEFAMFLPRCDLDAAGELVARLRATLLAHDWSQHGIAAPQTASFGTATLERADAGIAQALARADRGLYAAKRSGRDRLEVLRAA